MIADLVFMIYMSLLTTATLIFCKQSVHNDIVESARGSFLTKLMICHTVIIGAIVAISWGATEGFLNPNFLPTVIITTLIIFFALLFNKQKTFKSLNAHFQLNALVDVVVLVYSILVVMKQVY